MSSERLKSGHSIKVVNYAICMEHDVFGSIREVFGVGVEVRLDDVPIWSRREYERFNGLLDMFPVFPRKPFYKKRIESALREAEIFARQLSEFPYWVTKED